MSVDARPCYETTTTKTVLAALRAAPARGRMTLITGPSGCGKSDAVDLAIRDLTRLTRVDAAPWPSSARGFFEYLCRCLQLDVRRQDGATDLAWAVVTHLREGDRLLCLDSAEDLRPGLWSTIRWLVDTLPALVVVGTEAVRDRAAVEPFLRSRATLPIQVGGLDLPELVASFGNRFSEDWLRTVLIKAGGQWSEVWKMIAGAEAQCRNRGIETVGLTGADADSLAERVLLRVA